MKKRIISIALVLALVLGIAPVYASEDVSVSVSDEAALAEWEASLGEFTETPANAYTPSELKNLVGAKTSAHAYEVDFSGEEDVKIAPAKFVEGEVLYSREKKISLFSTDNVSSELEAIGITNSEEIYSTSEVSLFSGESEGKTWYKAEISGDVEETVAALEKIDGIADAEPNYIYEQTTEGDAIEVLHQNGVPKEKERKESWFMRNGEGHNGIHVIEGWEASYKKTKAAPGAGVVVAVIDTGVDYTHEDLAPNMWTNAGEIPGNNIDDDGNGYIDDYYGINATANPKTDKAKAGNPMDDNGHGTHVAGIIAMANNGIGGAGVAYGAKIMAIKAGQSTGTLSSADITEAIEYATMMGADVINMSFGGTGRSSLVEDALESAFTSCVLVAAAGNDGIPTADAPADFMVKADFYPAGYKYVLGVMASDERGNKAGFSNWDYINNANCEYEMIAPGTNVYSTLPGNRYAKWNGTSMASPTVAAAAAVIRSNYPDKNEYNSRFIMGQLASASDLSTTYVDKNYDAHAYTRLDLLQSLTRLPEPNISVSQVFALDDAGDNDSIIDAGETIDLGIEIRNQWGKTGEIKIKADAEQNGIPNPYVTFVTDEITLPAAGTFSSVDNGYVWDDGLLSDVLNPIRFTVAEDCPNDTKIKINLTVTTTNGWDEKDKTVYDAESGFTFRVQRGVAISGHISEDTTLTADKYWIIQNALVIDEGATLNVEPGTQIQFWSSDYEDAYGQKSIVYINNKGTLNMIGTEDAPIEMFPGAEFEEYAVLIYGAGVETLKYCEIVNAVLGGSTTPIENCAYDRFIQNELGLYTRSSSGDRNIVTAPFEIVNLEKTSLENYGRGTGWLDHTAACVVGNMKSILVENCSISFALSTYSDIEFLRNTDSVYIGGAVKGRTVGASVIRPTYKTPKTPPTFTTPTTYDGATSKYIYMEPYTYNSGTSTKTEECSYDIATAVAKSMGGGLACFNDETEEAFLCDMLWKIGEARRPEGDTISTIRQYTFIGYEYDEKAGYYSWLDGNDFKPTIHTSRITGTFATKPYCYLDISCYPTKHTDDIMNAASNIGTSYGYLLEVPATLSDDEINEAIENFDYKTWLEDYHWNIKNSAVLNPVLNTNTDVWAKLRAPSYTSTHYYIAKNNYWGTENKALINKMIVDDDDVAGSYADIVEDPILTLDDDLSAIYPFVTEVYMTEVGGTARIEDAAPGTTYEVHVKFNRDMAEDSEPSVTYGSEAPFTDYGVMGDWVSAREWVGQTKISSVATGGNMIFRTSGAAAADDKWLVCGTDQERFQFNINSSSALSMVLNATGEVDKVELSWIQNDYELLGGYNLYRSTKPDSGFTKINGTILTDLTYTDTDVSAGVTYYYYFTVVDTMGNEITDSKSNVASATPLDNIKPTITHTTIKSAKAGQAITVSAKASDNIAVDKVKLFYRKSGDEAYSEKVITYNGTTAVYVGTIPGDAVTASGVEYYLEVSDNVGNRAYSASAAVPYVITVDISPTILAVYPSVINMGTTLPNITVYGSNFVSDMTVKLGTATISEFTVSESGDSITFSAPNLSNGAYQISITANGATATKSSAITYRDSASFVQINEATALMGETTKIPVYVGANGDITALYTEFEIPTTYFSSAKAELASGVAASMVQNFSGGVLKVSMSAAESFKPESTSAPLFYITLTPKTVEAETVTHITLKSAEINGAETVLDPIKTAITIKPKFSLNAIVQYFKNKIAVPDVKIIAGGVEAVTGTDGKAALTGIARPDVTVTASRESSADALDPMDAVLILRSRVGLEELDANQQIAADVNADGKVNEVDASLILKRTVFLIDSFPAGDWAFVPSSQSVTLTASTKTVSFTAIMIGDVDGSFK